MEEEEKTLAREKCNTALTQASVIENTERRAEAQKNDMMYCLSSMKKMKRAMSDAEQRLEQARKQINADAEEVIHKGGIRL